MSLFHHCLVAVVQGCRPQRVDSGEQINVTRCNAQASTGCPSAAIVKPLARGHILQYGQHVTQSAKGCWGGRARWTTKEVTIIYLFNFLLVYFYACSHPFFPPLNPHDRLEDICNAGNKDVLLEADSAREGGGEGGGLAQIHEDPGERISAAYFLVLMEVDKAVGPLEVDCARGRGHEGGCGLMDLLAVPVCPQIMTNRRGQWWKMKNTTINELTDEDGGEDEEKGGGRVPMLPLFSDVVAIAIVGWRDNAQQSTRVGGCKCWKEGDEV